MYLQQRNYSLAKCWLPNGTQVAWNKQPMGTLLLLDCTFCSFPFCCSSGLSARAVHTMGTTTPSRAFSKSWAFLRTLTEGYIMTVHTTTHRKGRTRQLSDCISDDQSVYLTPFSWSLSSCPYVCLSTCPSVCSSAYLCICYPSYRSLIFTHQWCTMSLTR